MHVVTFFSLLAPTFIATVLLSSGIGHVIDFRSFAAVVRSQGLVPHRSVGRIAAGVVCVELLLGGGALAVLTGRVPRGWTLTLTSGSLVVALAFFIYLRRLLRRPHAAATCGCSPLESPLSELSRVPAAALAVVASIGLLAVLIQPADATLSIASLAERALPVMWGVALAGIVLLVPAAVKVRELSSAEAAGR